MACVIKYIYNNDSPGLPLSHKVDDRLPMCMEIRVLIFLMMNQTCTVALQVSGWSFETTSPKSADIIIIFQPVSNDPFTVWQLQYILIKFSLRRLDSQIYPTWSNEACTLIVGHAGLIDHEQKMQLLWMAAEACRL